MSEISRLKKIIEQKNEQIIRIKQNYNNTLEENNKLKEATDNLMQENEELKERIESLRATINYHKEIDEIQEAENKQLKYMLDQKTAEIDILKYNAMKIPVDMSDEEAAAISERLKNECTLVVPDETATAFNELKAKYEKLNADSVNTIDILKKEIEKWKQKCKELEYTCEQYRTGYDVLKNKGKEQLELAERKKEAEIYKAMYQQLIKYHIGDCAYE